MWRAERFAALSDKLHDSAGADVVFTGTANDAAYVDGIRRMMKRPLLESRGKNEHKDSRRPHKDRRACRKLRLGGNASFFGHGYPGRGHIRPDSAELYRAFWQKINCHKRGGRVLALQGKGLRRGQMHG